MTNTHRLQVVTLERVDDDEDDGKLIRLRPSLSALGEVTDVETMAAFLGVHHKTLRAHIAMYKSRPDLDPPGVMRIGRAMRIKTATFLEWLEDGSP
ncbi:MAG: hypothetical protein VYE40_07915 [Myxococcota bacterium]|nr:hypothetical protein [Myxococcota bacterium]MEC9441008.1 hypothetical protein [Myxococcota bacterium]